MIWKATFVVLPTRPYRWVGRVVALIPQSDKQTASLLGQHLQHLKGGRLRSADVSLGCRCPRNGRRCCRLTRWRWSQKVYSSQEEIQFPGRDESLTRISKDIANSSTLVRTAGLSFGGCWVKIVMAVSRSPCSVNQLFWVICFRNPDLLITASFPIDVFIFQENEF